MKKTLWVLIPLVLASAGAIVWMVMMPPKSLLQSVMDDAAQTSGLRDVQLVDYRGGWDTSSASFKFEYQCNSQSSIVQVDADFRKVGSRWVLNNAYTGNERYSNVEDIGDHVMLGLCAKDLGKKASEAIDEVSRKWDELVN